MKITLTLDQQDHIVAKKLKQTIEMLRYQKAQAVASKRGFVFSNDLEEDVVRLNERIDAMKLIIGYFSVQQHTKDN